MERKIEELLAQFNEKYTMEKLEDATVLGEANGYLEALKDMAVTPELKAKICGIGAKMCICSLAHDIVKTVFTK